MNMVELVEIYTESSEYDPELKNVRRQVGLRHIYVNPTCVVYMRENNGIGLAQPMDAMVDGKELDERTQFTKLSFVSQGVNSVTVNVVGDPDTIAKKLLGS